MYRVGGHIWKRQIKLRASINFKITALVAILENGGLET